MVQCGHFFLLENYSTDLESQHFKDQHKTWELIFYAGPIRITLKLPEPFHSLTWHSCQVTGSVHSNQFHIVLKTHKHREYFIKCYSLWVTKRRPISHFRVPFTEGLFSSNFHLGILCVVKCYCFQTTKMIWNMQMFSITKRNTNWDIEPLPEYGEQKIFFRIQFHISVFYAIFSSIGF